MEHDNETFHYTYSAKQREEVENIRRKYLPKSEDKMEKLRQLDRGTTTKGTIVSIVLGIVGCLLLGVGMSCTMAWSSQWFVPGVIVGLIGIAAMAVAYPVYRRITRCEREKIAPQILQLTEELNARSS